MSGLFDIIKKQWKYAGYFTTVRNEYASISEIGWGDDPGIGIRLDLAAFSMQSKTEHLLEAFCQECMTLGILARVCAEIICIFAYVDMEIPHRFIAGEFDRAWLAAKWSNDRKLLRQGKALDYYGMSDFEVGSRDFRLAKEVDTVSQPNAQQSRATYGRFVTSSSNRHDGNKMPANLITSANASLRPGVIRNSSSSSSCKWRVHAGSLENRSTGDVFSIVLSATPAKGEVIRDGNGFRFHPSQFYRHVGDWEIEYAR
jgi:hypothetical protein